MDAQATRDIMMADFEAVDDMVVVQEVEVRDEGDQDEVQQDTQGGDMVMNTLKHTKVDDAVALAEEIQGGGDAIAQEDGTAGNTLAVDADDAVVLLAVEVEEEDDLEDPLEEIQRDPEDPEDPQANMDHSSTLDPTTSRKEDVKVPYACDICKQTFTRSSSLLRHSRRHSGDGLLCLPCGKRFTGADTFKRHIESSHRGIRWPCTVNNCTKVFRTKGGLLNHEKIHNGSFRFLCLVYGAGFVYKSTHDHHLAKHTGERPYKCNTCERCFTHTSALAQHRQSCGMHDQPFGCPLCPVKFKTKRYLREKYKHRASLYNHRKSKH